MKRFFRGLLARLLAGVLFLCVFPLSVGAAEETLYFGQLHSHSGDADSLGLAEAVYASAKEAGMDFFALTDYSHSFDGAQEGCLSTDGKEISMTWAEGKQAAMAAASEDFAALYGFEMAWERDLRLGHMVTLATPGWQCRGQEGMEDLEGYYEALNAVEGAIGMFCHPGDDFGSFSGFSYHSAPVYLVEVVGEGGKTYYDGYQKALDKGWKVAPSAGGASHEGDWGSVSQARTVILARSLTEESLYDAIRSGKVYATEDADLAVRYALDGRPMGAILSEWEAGSLRIELEDPTDGLSGILDVVTTQGEVLLEAPLSAEMELTVPSGYPYYYLRITQSDGDVAVTAPVWVETPWDLGFGSLEVSTETAVQGEELEFSLPLYNREEDALTLQSFLLLADGEEVWTSEGPVTLAPGETGALTIPYTHQGLGETSFHLKAFGLLGDREVVLETQWDLSFLPPMMQARILVDGIHSQVREEALNSLKVLAAEKDLTVEILREGLPETGELLILPPAEEAYSEEYAEAVRGHLENGGKLILCGSAGGNAYQNELLACLGSTMSFHNDRALDPVHNGGEPYEVHTQRLNPQADCWAANQEGAVYSHLEGCTLDTGEGTWLAKGNTTLEADSRVLLAREEVGGGVIYAAGTFFLSDDHMPLPENQWDPPRGNQLLLEYLLQLRRSQLPISTIREARGAEEEDVFRVKGYVTSGTSDPWNRFPGLVYLQDASGGIGITAFAIGDIEVGMCLDVVGSFTMEDGNPALKLIRCQILEGDDYRYDPEVEEIAQAMDYDRYGGQLRRIEGTVVELEDTREGCGLRALTLRDHRGDEARVVIEEGILSGAYGVNDLANQIEEGDRVRAMGILHLAQPGQPVLRVRNCDEVVRIPPVEEEREEEASAEPDLSNPKTGDWRWE